MVRSVKDLRKAEENERAKARAEQADAQARRDLANKMDGTIDPYVPLKENERAQREEESAQNHTNTANDLSRQAATIQNQIVELERQKQTKQEAHQIEIDRLDAEIRQLKGE